MESNPPDSPFPYTAYPRPGLRKISTAPDGVVGFRALYAASDKKHLFAAVADRLFFIDHGGTFKELGKIEPGSTPISMVDNGTVLQVANGKEKIGYEVELDTLEFRQIGTSLLSIEVDDAGEGYKSAPKVTIEMPEGPEPIQAKAEAIIKDEKIHKITLTLAGQGYLSPPKVTISGGHPDQDGKASATIDDENFRGAVGMAYLDTFLLYSEPNSHRFYTTLSNVTEIDPLYEASKVGRPDPLQTLVVVHREIWLIGTLSTECWFNAGAPAFPFAEQSGVFIEHGTPAPYSVVTHALEVLFLARDKDGYATVVMITAYTIKKISTYALEQELLSYTRLDDAIGQVFQMAGHVFYVLTFPTQDKTWAFDMMEGQWAEWTWTDRDGGEHRHRGSSAIAFCYGKTWCGDWENGNLYQMDMDLFHDNYSEIVFRRTFPHMQSSSKRISYPSFIAEMQAGEIPGGVFRPAHGAFGSSYSSDFDILTGDTYWETNPEIFLRWSDDRGKSWGNPVGQSIGKTGEYEKSLNFQRLGMARDRVFELFWSLPIKTALMGASVETTVAGT